METPRHITVADGLPTLDIYDILQDTSGIIWIGTDVGIARYNGYEFNVLTTRDGLPNNDVISLKTDIFNRLWISSFGPISVLNNEEVQLSDYNSDKVKDLAFNLMPSAEGGMWINNQKSIEYLDSSLQQRSLPAQVSGVTSGRISSIFPARADSVFISNSKWLYLTYNQQLIDSLLLPSEVFPIEAYAYDQSKECFYLSNNDAIYVWLPGEEAIAVSSTYRENSKLEVINEQLFVLSSNLGLEVFDIEQNKLFLSQIFNPSTYYNSFLVDEEGNLWLSTLGDGLFFYAQQTINVRQISLPSAHQRVNKLISNRGQLILGTYSGRLYSYQPATDELIFLQESQSNYKEVLDRIMDITSLPDSSLLVGKDSGLYWWKNDSLKLVNRSAAKSLFATPEGEILLNTAHFFVKFRIEDIPGLPAKDVKLLSEYVDFFSPERGYSSTITKDGKIWSHSTEKGLTVYQDGQATYLQEMDNVFKVHLNDILELADGTLVLASQGEGVILLKNNDFWIVDESKQLPSSIVNSIHVIEEDIWVATNKGVAKLTELNFEKREVNVKVYNKNDGFLSEDIADLTIWQDQLIMATDNGLMSFPLTASPTKIKEPFPRISLQSVRAGGKVLELNRRTELFAQQNNLEFNYQGLSFRSWGDIRYRYRLKGFEDEWKVTRSRQLNYHNLPAGEYELEVQAIDYQGIPSKRTANYSFLISPSLNERPLFWVGILSCGLLLLYWAFFSYTNIRKRKELASLVREKTADLDQQLEELARSNEELEQFARAASHDLKSPLRNVASFVQLLGRRAKDRLNESEKEYITLAVQGVKKMEATIEDMLRVTRIDQQDEEKEELDFNEIIIEIKQANQSRITEESVVIQVVGTLPNMLFSRVNAYQLLQNLIINAITYRSEAAPIIEIGSEDAGAFWSFYVKDNGIGIAEEFHNQIFEIFQRLHNDSDIPGTGIGLAICRKIVERSGGKITLTSTVGEGTTFFFTLPKG